MESPLPLAGTTWDEMWDRVIWALDHAVTVHRATPVPKWGCLLPRQPHHLARSHGPPPYPVESSTYNA
jgi:hypothetical protein